MKKNNKVEDKTKSEYEQAMVDMECWEAIKHIKKCPKCREKIINN